MDETLRLEYCCTPGECKEAQDLLLRQRFGGGSKWIAMSVLLAILALMLVSFFLQVKPGHRWYMIPLAAGFSLIVMVYVRSREKRASKVATSNALIEISAREIRFGGESGWSSAPWSSFGKLLESDTLFVLPDRQGASLAIFPKRAFPDQAWCDWFRELADAVGAAADRSEFGGNQTTHAIEATDPGSVTLDLRLRFFDYFDRSLASWRTRGAMIVAATLILVSFAISAFNPPPNPVYTFAQVFFFFGLPMLMIMELMVFCLFTIGAWFNDRRNARSQSVTISEKGVSWTAADGHANLTWDERVRYKETPWSFFLWWQSTGAWLQLPKRDFGTLDGPARCRDMLSRHATKSGWFFG